MRFGSGSCIFLSGTEKSQPYKTLHSQTEHKLNETQKRGTRPRGQ
ncbi:hypothetical protein OROGR_026806 [Orobanche gracilis]